MPASTIWVETTAPVCGPGGAGLILSQPRVANLFAYRGDTGRFRVQVTDGVGGDPIDLTTATWDCDIRAEDDDVLLLGNMTVTLVDDEMVEVYLPPSLSAVLPPASVYDLQMNLDGDVHTLVRGSITISSDVSRSTGTSAYDFIVSPSDPIATLILNDGVAEGFGAGIWTATIDGTTTVPVGGFTVGGAVNVAVDCTTVTTGVHTLTLEHSNGRAWTATLLMESA